MIMSSYKEICGCMHIHFPLNRLEKTFEYVANAGNAAGVDFIVINSHTPEKNKSRYEKLFAREGYYGKTLVIKSEETHDKNRQNHLLVIGGDKWYGGRDRASQVLAETGKAGCVSFVAHPEGFHRFFLYKKEYRWDDWTLDGFTGIEIWSMLFDWAKFTRAYNIPARYLNLPLNLKGPSSSLLSMWDKLAGEKKAVGIAGLDIHALPFFFRCLDVKNRFVYANVFKVLRNHLLLKEELSLDACEDKKKIVEALRLGNLFFSNDYIADSSGFYFGSESGSLIMGGSGQRGEKLVVKNPARAKTKLVFNGCALWERETEYESFSAENPGTYRAEVSLNGLPWIFSNHILIE
jgi:hypothetical protein